MKIIKNYQKYELYHPGTKFILLYTPIIHNRYWRLLSFTIHYHFTWAVLYTFQDTICIFLIYFIFKIINFYFILGFVQENNNSIRLHLTISKFIYDLSLYRCTVIQEVYFILIWATYINFDKLHFVE